MARHGQHRSLLGWLFVTPWLVGFVALVAWPFLASLYWSFCRYDILSAPEYVGLANYQRLAEELWQGGKLGRAAWNTAYYAGLSVPLSILLGVGLATLLSQRVYGRSLFRTLFYLPSLLPAVATSILWMWLLDPKSGWVNQLLLRAGWPAAQLPGWAASRHEAAWPPNWGDFGSKDALVLMSLWGVGNFVLLYATRLAEIPPALYEAAALEGAGPWKRFRHISLPLLSPIIFFNLVMGLIQAMQAFTQVYLISEGTGKPADSTLLLSLHLFLAAFRDLELGYASAVAWLMFLPLALITWSLFRSAKYWVHYGS